MSLLDTASLVVTPNGTKASKLYSVVPSSGAGDLDVTRATTATRVNSSGLIESVASNVPRLDYTNGSCPSILVEPQRTNISRFVESGTGGFNEATVTAGTSILGLTTFKVTTNNILFGDNPSIELNTQYQANTTYTLSFYTDFSKCNDTAITCSFLAFFPTLGYAGIRVDKTTKAITTFNVGGIWTLNSYEAKQISGEIYRIIVTATPILTGAGASRNYINAENNTKYAEFAGIQLEAGSYATSFINKASSSSVTRNADVINKTGISSLIGLTEGTMFFDFNKTNDVDSSGALLMILYANATPSTNRIQFVISNNFLELYATDGTNAVYSGGITTLADGRHKIAVNYGSNGFKVYLNGTSVFTNSATWVPTMDSIRFGSYVTDVAFFSDSINQSSLWKTQLTNTQLAQLTTI